MRLKGALLLSEEQRDLHQAEEVLLASLEVARNQDAKSWELRTATTIARVWAHVGKRRESRNLLAPICEWFSGSDTPDLVDARQMLNL